MLNLISEIINIEVFTIISSISTAVAAIASLASCIIVISLNRPKIKVKFYKQLYYIWKNEKLGLIDFDIYNRTALAGMIDEMFVMLNGKKYDCDIANTNYLPFGEIEVTCGTDQLLYRNVEQCKYKIPILVKGYSSISGFIVVPNFPDIDDGNLKAHIFFHIAHTHRIRKVPVTFTKSFVEPK